MRALSFLLVLFSVQVNAAVISRPSAERFAEVKGILEKQRNTPGDQRIICFDKDAKEVLIMATSNLGYPLLRPLFKAKRFGYLTPNLQSERTPYNVPNYTITYFGVVEGTLVQIGFRAYPMYRRPTPIRADLIIADKLEVLSCFTD